MRIDTAGHAFDVTPAIRRYCDLRASDAVGPLETLVDILAVRLVAAPGSPGVAPVRCRMVAHLLEGRPVCVEASDHSAHGAIDRAAARLGDGLAARGFRPVAANKRAPRPVAAESVRRGRGLGVLDLGVVFGAPGRARRPA